MNRFPYCVGIIPARYESSRFPGKPLADILGRPMIWHVYQRAIQCPELQHVALATDDRRIAKAADQLDIPVVMTRRDHPSGTDRVLEAARKIKVPEDAVVVNIQGDEPALDPEMLSELLNPFKSPSVQVTTLARAIEPAEARNPDQVKVVFSKDQSALYFSRAPIPFPRDEVESGYFGHIGLYAFRLPVLRRFVELGTSRHERIEKLEQLRLLDHGIPIHVVVTRHTSVGVDRPEDIETVSQLLAGSL